jgi:hypothetical protein
MGFAEHDGSARFQEARFCRGKREMSTVKGRIRQEN